MTILGDLLDYISKCARDTRASAQNIEQKPEPNCVDQEWEEKIIELFQDLNNWEWAGFSDIEQIECNKYDGFQIKVQKSYYRYVPLSDRLIPIHIDPCEIVVFTHLGTRIAFLKEYYFGQSMFFLIQDIHDKIKNRYYEELNKKSINKSSNALKELNNIMGK